MYRVHTVVTSAQWEIEEAASDDCAAINLEVWYTEKNINDHYITNLGSVVESLIGYVGRDGLFTQSYGIDFDGSGALEMDGFLPDGSFGLNELEESFPGGAPGYGCNETEAQWNVSKCVQGRWYVRPHS